MEQSTPAAEGRSTRGDFHIVCGKTTKDLSGLGDL
jgi:hypothetical protein